VDVGEQHGELACVEAHEIRVAVKAAKALASGMVESGRRDRQLADLLAHRGLLAVEDERWRSSLPEASLKITFQPRGRPASVRAAR